MTSRGLLFRDVELDGRPGLDVRIRGQRVVAVGRALGAADDRVVDGGGAALLPGMHDHHLHLTALAAAADSVVCGPPGVVDRGSLAEALRRAAAARPSGAWLRGRGYHESVAGLLDRDDLDLLVPDRPVRIQHRGGALWMLNTTAIRLLDVEGWGEAGVERAPDGRPTGRLWGADRRLGEELVRTVGPVAAPDLAAVGRRLAALGITGVTDATPDLAPAMAGALEQAASDGSLPQRLLLLGASATPRASRVRRGPVKIWLPDFEPPDLDRVVAALRAGRAEYGPVAVHCVTREGLVVLLAALQQIGALPEDRIEHASLVPEELLPEIARLGVRVVTQPAFVADRGDEYLTSVEPADRRDLYRYASLLTAGVPVAPSSDAPFGDVDPWAILRAARDRRTTSGRTVAAEESVGVSTALAGLLSPLSAPGAPARRVTVGASADLCLLDAPLAEVLRAPHAGLVRLTMCSGAVVHGA